MIMPTDFEVLRFIYVYKLLADQGKADEPGGAEFRRVFVEWMEAGKPDGENFITERANAIPKEQRKHEQ